MKHVLVVVIVLIGFLSVLGEKMISVGTNAPGFTLLSDNGEEVTLSSFQGKKYVVLIFYPGDETPICTQQLCEIRDDYSKFESRGAIVFGVNPGSQQSHQDFVNKNSFQFRLLIDEKRKVAKLFKAKGLLMNQRTVYVIDKDGIIVFAERGKPSVKRILKSIPEN